MILRPGHSFRFLEERYRGGKSLFRKVLRRPPVASNRQIRPTRSIKAVLSAKHFDLYTRLKELGLSVLNLSQDEGPQSWLLRTFCYGPPKIPKARENRSQSERVHCRSQHE